MISYGVRQLLDSNWTQVSKYSWGISGGARIDDINDLMGEELIVSDPKVMMGKPVIKGTRITVELILERLSLGERPEDLLLAYPHINIEQIKAALAYAAETLKGDQIISFA